VRSLVGLLPLIAVEIIEQETIDRLPGFKKRMRWFLDHRHDLARFISYMECRGKDNPGARYLLAIPSRQRLLRVLRYLLDEDEFLSPFGIRSLSRFHQDHPVSFWMDGVEQRVEYVPGESNTGLFGGNSNWRGPIWFPVNYLLIEALQRYDHYYGPSLVVEFPTGSGRTMTLGDVALELSRRLTRLFLPEQADRNLTSEISNLKSQISDLASEEPIFFHEYFHGETGQGLGASHQTGWTALIVRCLEDLAKKGTKAKTERSQ
jgi:hypothetical protein